MIITITVDDKYQAIYDRALVDHGSNVVVDEVTNWLTDRETIQLDMDIEQAKRGLADTGTKTRLKARLGL